MGILVQEWFFFFFFFFFPSSSRYYTLFWFNYCITRPPSNLTLLPSPQAFTEASLKAQLQATCVKYQVADYSIVGPPGSVPLAQCICTAGQQKPASATCPPALHGWVHPRSWPARAKIRRTLHEQTKEALRRRLMPAERPSSPAARGGK